jgi:hypothetical protein
MTHIVAADGGMGEPQTADLLVLFGRRNETPQDVLFHQAACSRRVIWVDADTGEAELIKDNVGPRLDVKSVDLR